MAKQKSDQVIESDLLEYLNSYSQNKARGPSDRGESNY
jgi:hypothetical protein